MGKIMQLSSLLIDRRNYGLKIAKCIKSRQLLFPDQITDMIEFKDNTSYSDILAYSILKTQKGADDIETIKYIC